MSALDYLSAALLLLGFIFSLSGAIGLFRFPDFFTRIHASSVTDSSGAVCIILGLALQTNFDLVTVKLLFILFFLLLTGPTGSHALAKSARHGGLLTIPEYQEKAKDGVS